MTQGTLFLISAPSGAGKTSLVKALVENDERLCVSVSHTTRPTRPGEVDGLNYHFVDEEKFLSMLADGDFLESAEVYGHRYGTSQAWVNEQRSQGRDVILELDWQGAEQVRNLDPSACSIFILPPSLEALKERLQARAQDDVDTIQRRMQQARDDISHLAEADFLVVNDDFVTALADLQAIIRSYRLTARYQQDAQAGLLDKLARG